MKTHQYIIVILLLFVSHFSNGQSVGIRGGFEFAEKKQVNHTLGSGVFLILNDFSEKLHLICAFDYFGKNKQFLEKDLSTSYAKYKFSTGVLYVKPINKKFSFNVGPSVSYNILKSIHQGIFSRWIESYNARAVGIETIVSLEIKNIFKSPFCINVLMAPSYFINICHNIETLTDISGTRPEYRDNVLILIFQVGLSYINF